MEPGQYQFSIATNQQEYIVRARRNDRSWGHAIDAEIADSEGQLLNHVVFACHPEFREFELFQAMTTEQLISVIREVLESGRFKEALSSARANNLTLILRLNGHA